MHEFAITKSIVNMVQREANIANANRVTRIILVIGDLSTMVDESVQMYFDIISENTIVYGAELVFKRIKVKFKCKECENEFLKEENGFDCPLCGGMGELMEGAREFYIESIEVE